MALKNRNFKKNLEKVCKFSKLLEKKFNASDQKYERKIKSLSFEELQDLNEIVQRAHFILAKHEDKKEVYSLLKEFVDVIENSGNSIDLLNDEIGELIFSAENTLKRIKNLQNDVSNKFSLEKDNTEIQRQNAHDFESSTNNLTKSTTAVYT